MNKRGFTKTILIVLFLVLLFGLILYSSGITGKISFFSWLKSKTSEPKILKVQPQPPASDHIIVKFKKEISETQRNAIHAKTGGKLLFP